MPTYWIPNLSAILNLTTHERHSEPKLCSNPKMSCLHLPLDDVHDVHSHVHHERHVHHDGKTRFFCARIHEALNFIGQHLAEGGAVLVHCSKGINPNVFVGRDRPDLLGVLDVF
jgi:protein-tyrosine phosphatase